MEHKKFKDIILALVLLTPVILLYLSHYLIFIFHPDLIPTGFLQLDQPFYMAGAREYWDQGNFSFFYSNPADPSIHSPAIYFQLPVLILAILLKITGLDPGLLFVLFGLLSGWACIYVCIRFWREYAGGWKVADKLGLILFIWGGGLLFAGGLAWSVFSHHALTNPFIFDPSKGWWFLNWGRNLVLPLEAFYHLLFILMVKSIFNRKYNLSMLFAALLLLSHPFTGLQTMLIYASWVSYEAYYIRNKEIPAALPFIAVFLLVVHLLYYLVFLPSFPVHQQVFKQWRLSWNLSPISAMLAFLPVLLPGLYVLVVKKASGINLVFRHFLIILIAVSFILMFNNLFIEGYQALHFTRGYCWLGLFIASYPWLKDIIFKINKLQSILRLLILSLVLILMVSDNLSWFAISSRLELKGSHFQLSNAQNRVLDYLRFKAVKEDLILSDDGKISYLSTVYSPVRAVYSHWANTPEALKKVAQLNAFRVEGKIDESWKYQRLLFIMDVNKPLTRALTDSLAMHFMAVDSCYPYIIYHQKTD